jgi:UV DNA damage repair endonuclease
MAEKENDSSYWRGRAAEARAMADEMQDAKAKAIMLEIVESYERIAMSAEVHRSSSKEPDVDTPEHWHKRAKEARILADSLRDPNPKRVMLGIAESYEKLAKAAEERAKKPSRS